MAWSPWLFVRKEASPLVFNLEGGNGGRASTGCCPNHLPALGDMDADGHLDVLVGSDDNKVYCLSGKTGEVIWSYETDRWVSSSPALEDMDADGWLDAVVGSYDGHVYVLSGRSLAPRKANQYIWWGRKARLHSHTGQLAVASTTGILDFGYRIADCGLNIGRGSNEDATVQSEIRNPHRGGGEF